MSLVQHVIHASADILFHHKKTIDEWNKMIAKHETLMNEDQMRNDIKGWIENNIPIPKYLREKEPYFVADVCLNANRADLIPDIYPQYLKQRKNYERAERIENWINGIGCLLNLIITLAFWAFIIYLIYSITTGKHF
jgi:hypothetical protein